MKKIFTFCLILLFTITAQAQIRYLKGILQGSQEVPPVTSAGGGVVIVKYNTVTKTLELIGNYSGLTDSITAAHLHRGGPGVSGEVRVPLDHTRGTAGTLSKTATITQGFEDSLLTGNTYANVHSKAFGGGEIRAQLTQTTDGQTEFFTGRMQGAQEVPPNGSTAFGKVTTLLDKTTLEVFLTGDFHKLTTAATAAHIHRGPAGVNGPVIVGLSRTPDTSGTIWGRAVVSRTFADSMIAGNSYANIHNATFPGGEIRGQLTKLSQVRFLKATLQGSQEVPPNSSAARGTVIVTYSPDTKILELVGDYQNLSAPIGAAHIHSPAPPGANAAVFFTLNHTGKTSGVLTGRVTLNATNESELLGGLMYVNVHNANNPGGEIRGQLTTTTAGETQYFSNRLSGSQEVPSNTSMATGTVTVILDKKTNEVYLTGDFHNLAAATSMAHIHRGPAGTTGPAIFSLPFTSDTSGTITGNTVVSSSFADSMINGFTYANIHNSVYPGGELRAQLGNLVLPVKLEYFNGYKDQGKVVIIWESSQEVNVKHYEVEQQNEAGEWIKKATVAAAGGSSAMKYRISDIPMTGKKDYVLYRLKTVDASGIVSYSAVIRVNYTKTKALLTIMPNPVVNGKLVLSVTGIANNSKAEISILDLAGRVMLKNVVSTLSNNTIDVTKLSSGMYKLIVRMNDTVLQQSFSKQ